MRLQATTGGGFRVAPGNVRTLAVRRLASGMGAAPIRARPGRGGELQPGQGLSLGGILGGIGRGLAGFATGGITGAIGGIFGGGSSGGRSPIGDLPGQGFSGSACPTGFVLKDGICQQAGLAGGIARTLPGGSTGTLGVGGAAIVGAFGLPAMQPAQVGTITRNDGVVSPIFRCRPGMVLGKDDLCYPKQVLGARGKFRKHPAPRRPPVTAADAAAIRKADSAKNRVKKLAQGVGFTCRTRK